MLFARPNGLYRNATKAVRGANTYCFALQKRPFGLATGKPQGFSRTFPRPESDFQDIHTYVSQFYFVKEFYHPRRPIRPIHDVGIRQGTARPCPAANTASHTDQAGNAALRDRAKPHAPATPGVSSRQSTHTKRRQAPAKVFLADISKKISHFIAKHFGAPFFCYIFAPNKYKQTEMNKSYASFFYFYFYFASNCEAGSRV